jgi:two-component system sensor histidine kinase QseC
MTLSLRRRLLVFLLSATLAVWTAAAALSYVDSRRAIEAVFDAQLIQSAKALLLLSQHELYEQLFYESQQQSTTDHRLPEQVVGGAHPYEQSVAFQIWIDKDRLAVRSESAPSEPMTNKDDRLTSRVIDGNRWRIYAASNQNLKITVQVGERYERRMQLIDNITLRLLTSLLIALPLLALLIWVGVGRSLRPLNRLAGEVDTRRADSLEPIGTAQPVPEETRPLVNALNALLDRVRRALDNERRFTADAAHELRTPLAALKTQAQVALRAATDQERKDALQQVLRGVDRATHLVGQLLTLARLDPESPKVKNITLANVSVCDVARSVLADMAPKAIEKKIDLSLNEPCSGTARGNADLVGIMLGNLVGNALRYTPPHGQVEVSVLATAQGTVMQVADSGPGIPQEEHQKVFNRFYRQLGTVEPGSGLGLSIVQRILEIHHASVSLGSSHLGGLLVEIRFPG